MIIVKHIVSLIDLFPPLSFSPVCHQSSGPAVASRRGRGRLHPEGRQRGLWRSPEPVGRGGERGWWSQQDPTLHLHVIRDVENRLEGVKGHF